MATIALEPMRSVKTLGGGAEDYDKVTFTGTPQIGDICVKTNATVGVCGSDPSVISYISQIVASTSAIPGETKVHFQKVKPSETYQISAFHTTAANATVPDSALDGQANYGITSQVVSGVTAWCLDLEDTTNTCIRLIERLDTATDLYPRCLVQVLAANCTFI